jgi:hypothetical protein
MLPVKVEVRRGMLGAERSKRWYMAGRSQSPMVCCSWGSVCALFTACKRFIYYVLFIGALRYIHDGFAVDADDKDIFTALVIGGPLCEKKWVVYRGQAGEEYSMNSNIRTIVRYCRAQRRIRRSY